MAAPRSCNIKDRSRDAAADGPPGRLFRLPVAVKARLRGKGTLGEQQAQGKTDCRRCGVAPSANLFLHLHVIKGRGMAKELKADVAMAGSELISCCYRSIAAPDLTVRDVLDIVEASQVRNAEMQITGALLFAGGHFLQWLEGPADAVAGIMGYIGRDNRHHHVEILSHEPITERRFADWHMQLSCPETDSRFLGLAGCENVVTVGRSLLPDDTNILAIDRILALRRFLADVCAARGLARDPDSDGRTLAIFSMRGRAAQREARAEVSARLADMLLANPLSRLSDIESLLRAHAPAASDFAQLYETCAERMRRQLAEDRISALQVTLAASALQMVLRRIHHLPDPQKSHGAVTVTAAPGRKPILEAAIAGEMLRAAGWSTSVIHPESSRELLDRLKVTRTATLVIAPSLLEDTDHDGDIFRLIADVRAEADLPAQRILVGGRLGRMTPSMLREAGADAGFRHLSDLAGCVARVACPQNADCCSMRACRMPSMQCCDKRINSDFLLANVMPSVLSRMSARQDRRRSA